MLKISKLHCNSKMKLARNIHSSGELNGGEETLCLYEMCWTYSSHGVNAVDVVVRPAGGQFVGVLLLLCRDTKTE